MGHLRDSTITILNLLKLFVYKPITCLHLLMIVAEGIEWLVKKQNYKHSVQVYIMHYIDDFVYLSVSIMSR